MAGLLKARATVFIISGGYPGEDARGTNEEYRDWKEIPASGVITSGYYYRDSDVASDSDSSRVITFIEDSYSYTIDDNNYAHVTLTQKIQSMSRDDVHVSTIYVGTRNIRLWDRKGGRLLFERLNDPINTAHALISSPILVETKTFTIAPGGRTSVNDSLYLRANTPGHDSDPAPSQFVDECALGIEFRNDLPVDYRPGKIWNGTEWLSHNKSGGAADIAYNDGTTIRTMRTANGAIDSDNPPFINHPTDTMTARFRNMRKVGRE